MTKPVIAALYGLAALTAFRFVVAALTPLAGDEAYYWVWSKTLQSGYFDHPPGIALWIALGTLIANDTELGVRLLSPLGAVIASLALSEAGNRLFPQRRPGLRAAILLNATLIFAVGAVTSTPDTPLIVLWCVALWGVAGYVATARSWWWLVVGVAVGLALDTKYTAVLFAGGVALWLILSRPPSKAFKGWGFWAGALVALALFAPVIAWNAAHHWASFLKQGGRLVGFQPAAAAARLGDLIASQTALATPIIFVLFIVGMIHAWQGMRRNDDDRPAWSLLLLLTLPGLAVFLAKTFSDRVQGNWPAILFPTACIAAAAATMTWRRVWFDAAATLGLALGLLAYIQGTWSPFPLPVRLDPTALRMAGWAEFADAADKARQSGHGDYLASPDYDLASLLAFYAPPDARIVAIGERWAFFDLTSEPLATPAIAAVVSARPPPSAAYDGFFAQSMLQRKRDATPISAYSFVLARLSQADEPAVDLPRPRRVQPSIKTDISLERTVTPR